MCHEANIIGVSVKIKTPLTFGIALTHLWHCSYHQCPRLLLIIIIISVSHCPIASGFV